MILISSSTSTLFFHPFGASLTGWIIKDKDGIERDVVIGWNSPSSKTENPYLGCIAGRVANRIAGASFDLNGNHYVLPKNSGKHHLHGGINGLSKFHSVDVFIGGFKEWNIKNQDSSSVTFEIQSRHLEEGYPGSLDISVTYRLDDDELTVSISAKSSVDGPQLDTIFNSTFHPYFNLSGCTEKTVLDHVLHVYVKNYLESDNELIPTGRVLDLDTLPALDFSSPRTIGHSIATLRNQAHLGYDHFYIVSDSSDSFSDFHDTCLLRSEKTGITLVVSSTAPGFQIYTANYFSQIPVTKPIHKNLGLETYEENAGIAIECHAPPDAIHHDRWKDTVIVPYGKEWKSSTKYRLSIE